MATVIITDRPMSLDDLVATVDGAPVQIRGQQLLLIMSRAEEWVSH